MKKLSFFLMAMLISLVSFAEEATLSFADKAQRTSFSSTQQVWEQDGITFTNDKAKSSNAVADYANPVRLYQGSTITVECGKGNITKIVFATSESKYVTPLQNSLGTSLGAVATSGTNVTLTLSTPAASINAIALTAQVRLKTITVTYEKVQSTEPTITCGNVSFGMVKAGATSTKELVVEAENLTEAITATFETGTAFSVTGDLTTTGGTLTLAVIATEEGTYNDVLTLTSGTATKTVEVSANVITCQGEGTEEKPYLTADVIKLANSGEVAWVEGYIIGVMNNNELVTSNIETNSNIVIASTAEDTVTYVPVAIPTEIRKDINLVDNPTNIGKKIAVKGKLDAYFSMPGVRETSEYKWAVTKYTVTVAAENGTVEGDGEYEEGKEATLTATAAEGYEFVNWTVDGAEVSTENPYTFVVTANVALVANFKEVVVEPTTETVYFIDVKTWGKVNAYAWNTNGDNGWPGKAATKEAEQIAGFDVYSFTANAGEYDNVIFNDGSSQTPDLVWTAGKYYVVDMGWLTKEEAETELAAPLPEVWTIVGAAGLMGKDWDLNAAENAMTKQEDGTYKLEKKDITLTAGTYEYKAAKDHAWTVSVPSGNTNQKLTISKSGIYDVTFVLDVTAKKLTATATLKKEAVVIPTVVIAGDMNSWNQTKDKFTMAADSLTATFKATLAVKNYGFKMIVGGAWHSDGKTITRAANSTKFTGANSNTNSTLKADIAGEYLFTWEYATKTLTVTYPELPVEYTVTATVNPAETGTVAGAGKYEEGKEATLTATPAEGYEFVNWTVGDSIVSTENPYKFTVTADLALVANFKEVVKAIEVNVTGATSTSGEWSIDLAGSWNDQALTIRLWQDNTQGFGSYAPNADTGYYILLGAKELTPTTAGVYADNGDGTFTFTATATDAEGAIYNITLTGANPAAVEPETVEIEATVPFNVENGELYIDACEENYAWCLNFTISGYDGYGNYEVAGLYSTDNDYSVFGTLNVSYDEFQETDMIMGTLKTADESLVVLVTLYKEAAGEGQPTVLNVTDLVVNPETAAFEGTCITEQGMMLTLSLVPDLQKPVADKLMTYELNLEKSSIQIAAGLRPTPLTLTSGEIATDYATPAAVATVAASLDTETFLFTINMTAAAAEAIEIELEATSAVVDEDVLTLYATYEDEEGDTYPVAVELQGFENVVGDKEYKAEEICKITIGNSEVEEELMDVAYANSVMVIIGENGEISLEGEFSSWESGSDYYVTITGSLNGKQEPEYEVFEDVINNLVVTDEMAFIGGPSTTFGLKIFFVPGQKNANGTIALDLEQSSMARNDNDLTIVSGYLKDIDLSAPAANAVIVAQLSEFETYEFHLTMTSAPAEVTVISITDAAVVVDEWKDFPEAPTSNYALTMTADWTNEADGLTYPVKVEVLIYDPNVTEQPDAICNVVVGDLINGPWLGGVDGCYLTITTVEGVVTAKGVVTTSNNIALDLTISGKLPQGPGTGLDNVQVEVKTVKMIKNGQLIINKGGREFNAQGATLK